jgi:hypothetical protein
VLKTDTAQESQFCAAVKAGRDVVMGMMLRKGEKIAMKGRILTVTEVALDCLPRVRDHLIEMAKAGQTVTYGELRQV